MADSIQYNLAHDRDLTEQITVSVTPQMNEAMWNEVNNHNFRNRQDLIRLAVRNYLQSIGVTGAEHSPAVPTAQGWAEDKPYQQYSENKRAPSLEGLLVDRSREAKPFA